jgi:hypothetical protein
MFCHKGTKNFKIFITKARNFENTKTYHLVFWNQLSYNGDPILAL